MAVAEDDARTPRRRVPSGVTRDPERTAAAILAAAIKEFSEKGLGGARIDAIAGRAGVNKRMIYHYFGGKEALYIRALQEIYKGIRTAEQKLDLDSLDPPDAIRELARFSWRYFLATPEFLSMLATENINRGRYVKRAAWGKTVNFTLVDVLGRVLERGAANGQFKAGVDPVDIYVTMVSVGYFYLSNKYTLSAAFDRDFLDKQRLARWGEHMAEVILAYLKP